MKTQQKASERNVLNEYIAFIVVICALCGIIIGQHILDSEPQGIGGFVYKEIDWTEQTVGIMIEQCGGNAIILDDYSDSRHYRLWCMVKECNGEYCKDVKYEFPIKVSK